MDAIEAILIALAPGLAELIKTALADDYDQDAELQAVLKMQRALADERAKKLLDVP